MLTQLEGCVFIAPQPLGSACHPSWGLDLSPDVPVQLGHSPGTAGHSSRTRESASIGGAATEEGITDTSSARRRLTSISFAAPLPKLLQLLQ